VPAACSCHLGKAREGHLSSTVLQGDTLGMRIQYGMWIVPPPRLHIAGASAQIQISSCSRYDLQQQYRDPRHITSMLVHHVWSRRLAPKHACLRKGM
jgi:hypothetical protein